MHVPRTQLSIRRPLLLCKGAATSQKLALLLPVLMLLQVISFFLSIFLSHHRFLITATVSFL